MAMEELDEEMIQFEKDHPIKKPSQGGNAGAVRIAAIALLIEHHPTWFHTLHDYLFKYLFYAMLFGLWVLFVEKIRPRA